MLSHPGCKSSSRCLARGRVEVVDAALKQVLQRRFGLLLSHVRERGGAEDNARVFMPGGTERLSRDHGSFTAILAGVLGGDRWVELVDELLGVVTQSWLGGAPPPDTFDYQWLVVRDRATPPPSSTEGHARRLVRAGPRSSPS